MRTKELLLIGLVVLTQGIWLSAGSLVSDFSSGQVIVLPVAAARGEP